MVRRLIESFDHATTLATLFNGKWDTGAASFGIGSAGGRTGNGLRGGGNSAIYVDKSFDNQPTWVLGGAFRLNNPTAGITTLFNLYDAGTVQLDVVVNTTASMSVRRGGTVLATTGVDAFPTNAFAYVELKATIDPTAGAYDLHVNGVSVLSATGVNTRASANSYANRIAVGSLFNLQPVLDMDDLYIFDGTGATNNNFAGDCRVECLFPTANDAVAWTPVGAAANWDCVNDPNPDNDATYVTSSTPGQVDTYVLSDLVTTAGFVKCVQVVSYARKDDAGTRQIRNTIKPTGTRYNGTTVSLNTGYQFQTDGWEVNPDTSATWTIAEVNALKAGVEEVV
jgi:hypothetical protein